MIYTNCYACGQDGHVRAECPRRTNARRTELPAPAPAAAGPGEVDEIAAPMPRQQTATDYTGWAAYARTLIAPGNCGNTGDLVATTFRRQQKLGPAHECELRAAAAAQVTESRAARLLA